MEIEFEGGVYERQKYVDPLSDKYLDEYDSDYDEKGGKKRATTTKKQKPSEVWENPKNFLNDFQVEEKFDRFEDDDEENSKDLKKI